MFNTGKIAISSLVLVAIVYSFNFFNFIDEGKRDDCQCDKEKVIEIIKAKDFNSIPEYDTDDFDAGSLYELSGEENKRLWYRDIENPEPTKFTRYWDDYHMNNYHANHKDFIAFYDDKPNVELAFQFGPNWDLWAYHIFVIKKIDCCYLATRSYFRHARFTYKAYAIMDQSAVNELRKILDSVNKNSMDTVKWDYRGYFVDNSSDQEYFIDFDNEIDSLTNEPKVEISLLYNFVDNKIKWNESYSN